MAAASSYWKEHYVIETSPEEIEEKMKSTLSFLQANHLN